MDKSFKDLATEYVVKSKSVDVKAVVYALLAILEVLEEIRDADY